MSRGQFLPAREHLPVKTGKPLADLSRLPPAHEAAQVSYGGRGHSLTLMTVSTQRPDRSCPCRVGAGDLGREQSADHSDPGRERFLGVRGRADEGFYYLDSS